MNTANMALAGFERNFYLKLRSTKPCLIQDFCVKNECPDVYEQLLEQEFLIPAEIDEGEVYLSSLSKQINEHDTLAIHFLPTLGCNFRCPYCYQDGISRAGNMKKGDVDSIRHLLEQYLTQNPQIHKFALTLHGGEPTCNWDIVPYALATFKQIADAFALEFSTGIVSNGYLLTPEKSDLLAQYSWNRFQVTIDGLPDVHNKRRRLPNGQDTFSQIIENIKYIFDKDLLPVVDVRINFDQSNVDNIPSLIDYLSDIFAADKISLSFGYISQTVDGNESHEYIKDAQINYDDFSDKYTQLFRYAFSKGFPLKDCFLFGGLCMSKLRNSFAISPDGAIYKCLSMVGRESAQMANWRTISTLDGIPSMLDYEILKACLDEKCPFVPICNGDCRFDSLVCKGNIKIRNCRKDILFKLNSMILQEKYASFVEL